MAVSGLFSLDTMSGNLFCPGYLVASWTDEQLKWNSSEFNGITRFSTTSSDIWTPEFVQFYSAETRFTLKPALVYDNGTVIWMVGGLFEGLCQLDTLHYPFDEHVCEFAIQSSTYDVTEIQLKLLSDSNGLEFFTEHGQWEISSSISSTVKYVEPVSMVEFEILIRTLTVTRRHLFVLLHTAIPLFLMTVLNTLVYLVPLRSGERISFSTAILLNLVFFTTNVSEDLPHNSFRISFCSIVMTIANIMTTLSVIASVILCRVDHETITPVPNCLKTFVSGFIACRMKWTKIKTRVETLQAPDGKAVDKISYSEVTNPNSNLDNGAMPEITVTWSSVAESFDIILFDLNLSLLVLIWVVFSCLVMIK